MPSHGDSDVAAPVDGTAVGIESLPTALLVEILALVPVKTRLRCREVARAWRDALAERRAWASIDFSDMQPERITKRLVEATVARAGGALDALNVFNCSDMLRSVVLSITAAHAGTLRELWLFQNGFLSWEPFLTDLLRAAPALREVHAFPSLSRFSAKVAQKLLGGDLRYKTLRWQSMLVGSTYLTYSEPASDWVALFDAVAAHATLRALDTVLPPPHALPALVDAATRLTRLTLHACRPTPGAGTQLARLLRSSKLTTLEIVGDVLELEDLRGAKEFALALGECSSLLHLRLMRTRIWSDAQLSLLLLRVLTGHPTLRSFKTLFPHDRYDDPFATTPAAGLGAALAALVAANKPALAGLSFDVSLGRRQLRWVVEALPHNTHLRILELARISSNTFAREQLLPALSANTSLRSFKADIPDIPRKLSPSTTIETLMAARRAADAAPGNAQAT